MISKCLNLTPCVQVIFNPHYSGFRRVFRHQNHPLIASNGETQLVLSLKSEERLSLIL